MEYVYITENNLENRQHYQYSKFGGEEFLQAYLNSRQAFIEKYKNDDFSEKELLITIKNDLAQFEASGLPGDNFVLKCELLAMLSEYYEQDAFSSLEKLEKIVKTFEVRKRLYHQYNDKMRPLDESDYTSEELYVLFALLLINVATKNSDLQYLSTTIKVVDALISFASEQKEILAHICEKELLLTRALMEEYLGGTP